MKRPCKSHLKLYTRLLLCVCACAKYRTVKNIGGKKNFGEFGELQKFTKFFANFYYFHNTSYANRLHFAKVFSAKLPTVLIRQTFYHQSFLLYSTR